MTSKEQECGTERVSIVFDEPPRTNIEWSLTRIAEALERMAVQPDEKAALANLERIANALERIATDTGADGS